MFGSNNNQSTDNTQAGSVAPANNGGLSSFTMDPPHHDSSVNPALPPEPTASSIGEAPSAPHLDDSNLSSASMATTRNDLPADDAPSNLPPAQASSSDNGDTSSDELLSIKQKALSELSPIVSHLDQSPEEKFKTIMMMIQANDNQALIKDAYAAAEQIADEKVKSQALLDVVNEINYFTQNKSENN